MLECLRSFHRQPRLLTIWAVYRPSSSAHNLLRSRRIFLEGSALNAARERIYDWGNGRSPGRFLLARSCRDVRRGNTALVGLRVLVADGRRHITVAKQVRLGSKCRWFTLRGCRRRRLASDHHQPRLPVERKERRRVGDARTTRRRPRQRVGDLVRRREHGPDIPKRRSRGERSACRDRASGQTV